MKFPAWIALVVAALLGLLGSVYTVSEGQAAIVLNLGRVVRTDIGPGLHFKWPLVESARDFIIGHPAVRRVLDTQRAWIDGGRLRLTRRDWNSISASITQTRPVVSRRSDGAACLPPC
jgi:regulator of protease activity HflC (stomatin/prohibitin superfamily)